MVVVGLLRGAFVFFADLCRCVQIPHQIDFMILSSYHGTESTNVKVAKDMQIDPFNKHILIVEDLIDTGATLEWLKLHLESKKCASVKLCCLLDKQTKRRKANGLYLFFFFFFLFVFVLFFVFVYFVLFFEMNRIETNKRLLFDLKQINK